VEGFPRYTLRVARPVLVAARVAAADVVLVVQMGGIGGGESVADTGQFLGGFCLQSEMVEPRRIRPMRDCEVDARIFQHPLRIVGLLDRRRHAEQIRIEPDTGGQVGHAKMYMEASHLLLLLRKGEGTQAPGAQPGSH